jgi:hypothetical protein
MKILNAASLLIASLAISVSAIGKNANQCADVPNSVPEIDQASRKVTGCRLVSIESGSIYERLGLKKGDVVQPPTQTQNSNNSEMTLEISNSTKSGTNKGSLSRRNPAAAPKGKSDCSKFSTVPEEGCLENRDFTGQEFVEQPE